MSDEPDASGGGGDQRELVARLRAVIEAKDSENAMLRAELQAHLERYRRLELRLAELERRLGPDEREEVPPPAECSRCGTTLDGADRAGSWWSQVRDVKITTFVTEYLLPLLACPCCGKINAAQAPPWAHPGSISYGPGINTAAVLLTSYGNVPAERAANLIGMLPGVPVSAGFVDGASERLSSRLGGAGFDAELLAKLRGRYDEAAAFGITHNRHRGLARRQPPRLRPRLLAARLQRAGLAVHPRAGRVVRVRRGPRAGRPAGRPTGHTRPPAVTSTTRAAGHPAIAGTQRGYRPPAGTEAD